MTNQEEIRRQIQNRFGSPIVHREASPIGFAKPEPTLGDILREALTRRNAVPSPHRDFAEEERTETLAERMRVGVKEKPTISGGLNSYYLANVKHPQRTGQQPYQAECEDIIHALGMTFDEGCLFKALWRNAAARKGQGKPGSDPVYETEKMVHYAQRLLKHAKDAR